MRRSNETALLHEKHATSGGDWATTDIQSNHTVGLTVCSPSTAEEKEDVSLLLSSELCDTGVCPLGRGLMFRHCDRAR